MGGTVARLSDTTHLPLLANLLDKYAPLVKAYHCNLARIRSSHPTPATTTTTTTTTAADIIISMKALGMIQMAKRYIRTIRFDDEAEVECEVSERFALASALAPAIDQIKAIVMVQKKQIEEEDKANMLSILASRDG